MRLSFRSTGRVNLRGMPRFEQTQLGISFNACLNSSNFFLPLFLFSFSYLNAELEKEKEKEKEDEASP